MPVHRTWAAFAAGCAVVVGCGEPEPGSTGERAQREVEEAAEAVGEWTEEKRREYQADLEAYLDDLDERIAELEDEGEDLSGEAAEEWERQLERLKQQRDELEPQLEKLRESSGEAWNDVRENTEQAWNDVREDIKKAAERFEDEE